MKCCISSLRAAESLSFKFLCRAERKCKLLQKLARVLAKLLSCHSSLVLEGTIEQNWLCSRIFISIACRLPRSTALVSWGQQWCRCGRLKTKDKIKNVSVMHVSSVAFQLFASIRTYQSIATITLSHWIWSRTRWHPLYLVVFDCDCHLIVFRSRSFTFRRALQTPRKNVRGPTIKKTKCIKKTLHLSIVDCVECLCAGVCTERVTSHHSTVDQLLILGPRSAFARAPPNLVPARVISDKWPTARQEFSRSWWSWCHCRRRNERKEE